MNQAIENMLSRRSVRAYESTPVAKELLEQIIQAGLAAPSGRNRQPAVIVAITDKETLARLSRANGAVMGSANDPFYGAPAVLVVLADKSRNTSLYDGSLVMENLMLAAHSLGLGSCWIHRAKEVFDSEEGREILASLGIEGDYEGIGNCIVGYTQNPPAERKPRKENYVYKI